MDYPPYIVWFRGFPTCPCLARWLQVLERELLDRGVIRENIDIAQLTGTATESAGVHKGGGAFDLWQHDDTTVWVCRQMGADATWARTTGSFANNKHTHGVLTGCPHNAPARYQIDEVRQGGDGLTGSAPDTGPRPLSGRTWREGIAWAEEQHKNRLREQDDMPNYTDWTDRDKKALSKDVADEIMARKVRIVGAEGKKKEVTVKQALARIANGVISTRSDVGEVLDTLDEMNS